MGGMKVLIGPSSFGEEDRAPLERLAGRGLQVIPNPYRRKLTREELIGLLGVDVTGLIAGLEPLDREVLKRSCLKAISRCGSGMSNVDLEAARELGIAVTSTPDGPTTAVAELTLAALLCLLRGLHHTDRLMHRRQWDKQVGRQLAGKKVAIIGYGRIGRRVGRLLATFSAEVMAVDPAYAGDEAGVKKVSLEEALAVAEIVSLHSSGVQQIIGSSEIARMRDGVFLLNAARGGQIDEDALRAGLESGKVGGAWLDTFSREPYDGPLCDYPQVLLTSHVGSYTVEGRRAMEMEAVENLLRVLHK